MVREQYTQVRDELRGVTRRFLPSRLLQDPPTLEPTHS